MHIQLDSPMNRHEFLRKLGVAAATSATIGSTVLQSCQSKKDTATISLDSVSREASHHEKELFFKISLAEWSLNKDLFAGKLSHLDFPVKARKDFDIAAVEYVNQFFKDKAKDQMYLNELKKRCDDNGVTSVLIMCDEEGALADTDKKKRNQAIENHKKWLEAAKFLGCHAIRVNSFGTGSREEVAKAATEGLHDLSEIAKAYELNVIVENHGGYSSDGQWLSSVIKATGNSNCGTLPDFGNFCIRREKGDLWESPCVERYDKYKGVQEMMPYAKGVSAKTFDFDAEGNCIETDYPKMLSIIKASGFNGYMGIEYEGDKLPAEEGIKRTIALLKRVGSMIR